MSIFDRSARAIVIAPVAFLLGILIGPASVGAVILYAVAAIMLATSATGYCPLYTVLHIDTRKRQPLSR
ncbi:MAG: YgaP family membrane protein [Solirubrobacteraceae bacterium]